MDLIRVFVAIDPGEAVRTRFAAAREALAAHFTFPAVRWIEARDYHLTLVFLGQVRMSEITTIHAEVAAVAATLAPFRYQLDVACAFPDARRPRVIAALPADPDPFLRWQAPLAERLSAAGFAIERRTYRPHLTLARWKSRRECPQQAALSLLAEGEARALTLYESRGGHYHALFSERCTGAPADD